MDKIFRGVKIAGPVTAYIPILTVRPIKPKELKMAEIATKIVPFDAKVGRTKYHV
jgi:hypothetical protein